MPYWMIYTREREGADVDPWSPQFGDTVRSAVDAEVRDTYARDYARDDRCVVRFPSVPTRAEIDAKTAELNAAGWAS